MISGDIYNEQIARYEFSSDFVSKRVLNITNNRFVDYFSSRLLLKKNVSEIVNLYYHKDKIECTLRRKGKNNSIEFQVIDKSNLLEENSFDAIISFETIQHEKNQSDSLKKNFKLLKKDGVLIISTINKDISQVNHNLNRNEINNELDKLQFLKMLKETFSEVNLFSQIISVSSKKSGSLEKNNKKTKNHLNKIREQSHKIRLKIFMYLRMYSLYRLFFSETIASKTKNDVEHFMLDIQSTEYFPSMYVNGDQPLFFVAVCRK